MPPLFPLDVDNRLRVHVQPRTCHETGRVALQQGSRTSVLSLDRGLAARAGLFVVESEHAAADEALALQEHGRAAHSDLAGDSGIRPPGGGEQDEAGPLDQLLGGVARAHEEFEALALVGVEGEGLYRLEHG